MDLWLRSLWQIGSCVEVYSSNVWIKGNIVKILNDAEGESLEVQYMDTIKEIQTKQASRDDIHSIRPISKAMPIYRYIFNALNNIKTGDCNLQFSKRHSMHSVPPEIVLSITGYLSTDSLAYFSLISKTIRQYTKQHKIIDISQIIYHYSRNDFISILKILRFHHFKHWILPSNYFLCDSEATRLIINMMHSKFNEHGSKRQQYMTKSVAFEPLIKYHFLPVGSKDNKIIQSLSKLRLHHLKLKSISIAIPTKLLKLSQQTLKSIYSPYHSIADFLEEAKRFHNLETLCIASEKINDVVLSPRNLFGTSISDKFSKLKHLSFRKQCITNSFGNTLLFIASLPSLSTFSMAYCKFGSNKTKANKKQKSNTLKSLHLNTIKIGRHQLLNIADCFGQSLENIEFTQCALPTKREDWMYFAAECKYLTAICCTKTCVSIHTVYGREYSAVSAYWLRCNTKFDHHSLNMTLLEAFKNKTNINIIVEKLLNPLNAKKKVLITSNINPNEPEEYEQNSWSSSTRYEKCKLCESNVATGSMNDHLDSICNYRLIACTLCKNKIKRCDMVNHWNICTKYEYRCYHCFKSFKDRNKYLQHCTSHSERDDTLKRMFHFGNFHTEKHKKQFCDAKSIELAWQCLRCQRRCMGNKSKHQCPKECIDWSYDNMFNECRLCHLQVPIGKMTDHLENICINETIECNLCEQKLIRCDLVKHWNKKCVGYQKSNKALSMMRYSIPSLYGKYVIRYWVRNHIENLYELYSHIPIEIFRLIGEFYVHKHDFTHHKYQRYENGDFRINISEMLKCGICQNKKA